MSNPIAPGSSADVNIKVTALTTNPNVPVTYKTVILKKNLVNGVNTLTQEMMSTTNTKYVIKYDYVLGEDITIPENCVLEFDGGSISASGDNDTITGTNTSIQAEPIKIFNTDVILSGSWNVIESYPEWFGAVGDGIANDTYAVSKAIIADKVYFTFGKTYAVTGLIVNSNTIFEVNRATLKHYPSNNINCITVTDSELIIKNAVIDGNSSNMTGNTGNYYLVFANTRGSLKIYNSEISNTIGHCIGFGSPWVGNNRDDYAKDCCLIDSKIILSQDPTVVCDAVRIEKCNGAVVQNCHINGGYSGVRCQYYCKDIQVSNNIIENISRDVAITFALSENCIADNNVCMSCTRNWGTEIRGNVNIKITNNIFTDNHGGILVNRYKSPSGESYAGIVSSRYTNIAGNTQSGQSDVYMPNLDLVVNNNVFKRNTVVSEIYCNDGIFSGNYICDNKNENDACLVVGTDSSVVAASGQTLGEIADRKLVIKDNTFDCLYNKNAMAPNSFDHRSAIAQNNKYLNSSVTQLLIVGENIVHDIKELIDLYNDTYNDYRISTNVGILTISKGVNSPHIVVITAKGQQAGNITFIINEFTAGDSWVRTVTEQTINVATEYKTFILVIDKSRWTAIDSNNKLIVQLDGAEDNNLSLIDFKICNIVGK